MTVGAHRRCGVSRRRHAGLSKLNSMQRVADWELAPNDALDQVRSTCLVRMRRRHR